MSFQIPGHWWVQPRAVHPIYVTQHPLIERCRGRIASEAACGTAWPSLCDVVRRLHTECRISDVEMRAIMRAIETHMQPLRSAQRASHLYKCDTLSGDLQSRCKQWEAWATALVEQVQKELDTQV